MVIREWFADPKSSFPSRYQARIDQGVLQEFLHQAIEVDESTWLHGYSHVALCDATGTMTLEDGREGRWLLRPGGLGRLDWNDGTRSYLVG